MPSYFQINLGHLDIWQNDILFIQLKEIKCTFFNSILGIKIYSNQLFSFTLCRCWLGWWWLAALMGRVLYLLGCCLRVGRRIKSIDCVAVFNCSKLVSMDFYYGFSIKSQNVYYLIQGGWDNPYLVLLFNTLENILSCHHISNKKVSSEWLYPSSLFLRNLKHYFASKEPP